MLNSIVIVDYCSATIIIKLREIIPRLEQMIVKCSLGLAKKLYRSYGIIIFIVYGTKHSIA